MISTRRLRRSLPAPLRAARRGSAGCTNAPRAYAAVAARRRVRTSPLVNGWTLEDRSTRRAAARRSTSATATISCASRSASSQLALGLLPLLVAARRDAGPRPTPPRDPRRHRHRARCSRSICWSCSLYPWLVGNPNAFTDIVGTFLGLLTFVGGPVILWFALTYEQLRGVWALDPAMDEAARDAMLAAVDQYNRGDYLPAQEALENLFNTLPAEDQPLVRSLMILATAMHLHFRRGGGRGVLNLLRQSDGHPRRDQPRARRCRDRRALRRRAGVPAGARGPEEARRRLLRPLARPQDPLRVAEQVSRWRAPLRRRPLHHDPGLFNRRRRSGALHVLCGYR